MIFVLQFEGGEKDNNFKIKKKKEHPLQFETSSHGMSELKMKTHESQALLPKVNIENPKNKHFTTNENTILKLN